MTIIVVLEFVIVELVLEKVCETVLELVSVFDVVEVLVVDLVDVTLVIAVVLSDLALVESDAFAEVVVVVLYIPLALTVASIASSSACRTCASTHSCNDMPACFLLTRVVLVVVVRVDVVSVAVHRGRVVVLWRLAAFALQTAEEEPAYRNLPPRCCRCETLYVSDISWAWVMRKVTERRLCASVSVKGPSGTSSASSRSLLASAENQRRPSWPISTRTSV